MLLPAIVLAVLWLAPAAFAGEIYGSLREGGAPKANVEYQVLDAGNRPTSERQRTASNGSFHVTLPAGRFRLVVYVGGNPTADIVSSPNAAQYDFELVKRPDGSYHLARR
jgi:hypothetical protein